MLVAIISFMYTNESKFLFKLKDTLGGQISSFNQL